MELPALKLPEIPLPFEIPTLMHPPIDHFAIAIPVVVLLIELVNLFAKKRAVGFVAFFLLIVGAVAAVGAYLSGLHDGKEAYDMLTQAGREELREHRILGTYLMLASGVVVLFKLLSAMLRRGLMKATYLLVLVVFIAGMFKQGKDGGELVYEYGANVERLQEIDSELFDAKEELTEAEEKINELKAALAESKAALEAAKAQADQKAEESASKMKFNLSRKRLQAPAPAPTQAPQPTESIAVPPQASHNDAPAETAPTKEAVSDEGEAQAHEQADTPSADTPSAHNETAVSHTQEQESVAHDAPQAPQAQPQHP